MELQHTLELKRALFSSHSFPYADTASTLARVMLEAGGQTAAAIKLYADAVKIVEDSGERQRVVCRGKGIKGRGWAGCVQSNHGRGGTVQKRAPLGLGAEDSGGYW
jgi:hypothetical protein